MGLRQKAANLFRRRSLEENSVEHTKIDSAVLRDLCKRAPKLGLALADAPEVESHDEHGTKTPTLLDGDIWERLGEDVFYEFFGQQEPHVRQREEVEAKFRVNREIAAKMSRDDEFRDQRAATRGKTVESALATIGALSEIRSAYGDELKEHGDRQEEMSAQEDRLDKIDDMLAQAREAGDADKARELGGFKREAVERLEELEVEQAAAAADITKAVQGVVSKALSASERSIEAAALLPGKQAGAGARVPTETMLGLADRVAGNATLRRVLEMMGRLDLAMSSTRRNERKGGFEDIVDIELGAELAVVLPQEKALLMHPTTRLDFYRRFQEQSLMQYETVEQSELKRGPLMIARDGSYSMQGAANEWATGLSLAIAMLANREKRAAALMEFGGPGQLLCNEFPANQPISPVEAIEHAEHFFAGGTETLEALRCALGLVRESRPFHSADLILATDGEDTVNEEVIAIRDELREEGVKIHGIAIGIQPTAFLLEVCDHTTSIDDYAGHNDASKRLAIDIS